MEKSARNSNQFPAKDRIDNNMITLTIITGRPLPNYHSVLLEFGTYLHIFEDNDQSNTTKSRTTPAIAMDQIRNIQGGYLFMSLVTDFPLNR